MCQFTLLQAVYTVLCITLTFTNINMSYVNNFNKHNWAMSSFNTI